MPDLLFKKIICLSETLEQNYRVVRSVYTNDQYKHGLDFDLKLSTFNLTILKFHPRDYDILSRNF